MQNAFQAFARAVGWGTLAGAAPFMAVLFVPMTVAFMENGQIAGLLGVSLLLLSVSGIMVLGSAVIFGLPLTFFLSEREREHGGTYALAGLMLGALVPILLTSAEGGAMDESLLLLVVSGGFAGLVTGTSWGRWREAQRLAQDAD